MKYILTLVLLTFSVLSRAQTLEETETFIKTYIDAFPQNNGAEGETNEVFFRTTENDNYVFVYAKHLPYMGNLMTFFSPKDVVSVIIDKAQMKNKNCILTLYLKPNSGAFEVFQDDDNDYVDKVNITIGNASFTEDYPERIKKAILHMVELSGGKILDDKF